jgi:hypothetical protein
VLGPGSVGRLENDNNSRVTIATINFLFPVNEVPQRHFAVGQLAIKSNLLIREGVLYLDYHY